MKTIILCTTSRNHLRFLLPIIESLCKDNEVLLYCNYDELRNDSLCYSVETFLEKYENFHTLDLDEIAEFKSFAEKAHALLVTTGSSIIYHKFEFDLCYKVPCKTYAIQHGISQEGITRIPDIYYSADHVLTWVKKENIIKNAATPKEKFIPVGVPNHYYEKIDKIPNSKMFFFGRCFDAIDNSDIKLDTSNSFWKGIYTREWKHKVLDEIDSLCDESPCYFVRHPGANEPLHPKLTKILNRKNKFLVDTRWLDDNNVKRSQLYSMCDEYYITYPSSCFIDCMLNGLDYKMFVDYNGNVDVLDSKEKLQSINCTKKICEILLE